MNENLELIFNTPLFIIFGIAIWLIVTTMIGFMSGWFTLMRRYPDQANEVPLVKFSRESGYMGSLFGGMRGVLTISACQTGLRVGIMKMFGPFCNPFFVPWSDIKVTRKNYFFMKFAELNFGFDYGKLGIDGLIADQLWRALPESWPERGQPPKPRTRSEILGEVFRFWLGITLLASAFFLIAPRVMAPGEEGPPTVVAILFPAIFFGIFSLYEYARRMGMNK